MRAQRAVEGAAARPAKSVFPAILPGSILLKGLILKSLMLNSFILAATVGLAPDALAQDTQNPAVFFGTILQRRKHEEGSGSLVGPGATISVPLTVADNVRVTRTEVTCDAGSYDMDAQTYAAPYTRFGVRATCVARAFDPAGNEGMATLTFNVSGDPFPPRVIFTPATLTVVSGGTAMSTLFAADSVSRFAPDGGGITSGPDVDCTHGSFDPDTDIYTAPVVSVDTTATCTATAFDRADNRGRAV
ncbi:MAG: hypothetical protein GDA39_08620, partial [Hyphomonadaceae bacterium]|nr:hypothetical protein [Hyphomonadaceae bacterium]